MARATGSYPVGHGFKSNSRYHRPVGQAAKTPPFHGGNGSSILPRVTKKEHTPFGVCSFLLSRPNRTLRQRRRVRDVCEANSALSEAKQILPRTLFHTTRCALLFCFPAQIECSAFGMFFTRYSLQDSSLRSRMTPKEAAI